MGQSSSQTEEGERYINETIIGTEELYQVSESEMKERLHRHIGAFTYRAKNVN